MSLACTDCIGSGDTFLHNVVATFNIQDNTTTITQRSKYYQPRTST
jgi:predicted molibdopterin-dependent oxidoreductase YjgC